MSFLNKIKQWAAPNLPTKNCPHRYCRQVHQSWAVIGLAVLAPALFTEPLYMLFILGLAAVTYVFERLAWKGKSATDRAMEDEEQKALNEKDIAHLHRVDEGASKNQFDPKRTVFPGGLVVRKVWANIALGFDIFFALNIAAMLVVVVAMPTEDVYKVPNARSLGDYITLGIGIAILFFGQYAHRKATDTRKPRKQWFGLFSAAGSKA